MLPSGSGTRSGETTLPDGEAARPITSRSSSAEPQAAPRLPPRGDQERLPRWRRPEREGDPPGRGAQAHGTPAGEGDQIGAGRRERRRVTNRPAESHGPSCRRPGRGGGAHVIHLGAGRGCGPFRCVIGIPEAAVRPPQMGLLPIAHTPQGAGRGVTAVQAGVRRTGTRWVDRCPTSLSGPRGSHPLRLVKLASRCRTDCSRMGARP
jgi:hypothetical protein